MTGADHLAWLQSRRSVREFLATPLEREQLERLLLAATAAPSNTNRQPWHFTVVTAATVRAKIYDAVRCQAEEMSAIIRRGHHAEDFGSYADFFFEPLRTAAAIILPQYRVHPDLIADFVRSGGGDPERFPTAHAMQAEICSVSAATMNLLLQAHAEGLGACWMAGPTIARKQICEIIGIRAPWQMLGAVAVGQVSLPLPAAKARKPLDRVVEWIKETNSMGDIPEVAVSDEMQQQVCGMVAEALAIDLERVTPRALLMEELGAESLDFLDIVFRLERAYDIKITRGEIEAAAKGTMSDEEFAPDGVISAAGLERLRLLLPEAAERIVPGLRPVQVLSLFSARTFAKMVVAKQAGLTA